MDLPADTLSTVAKRRMHFLIARYANEMNEELDGLDVRPLMRAAALDASRAPNLGEANRRLTLVFNYMRLLLVERNLRPGPAPRVTPECSTYLQDMPSTRRDTSANWKP